MITPCDNRDCRYYQEIPELEEIEKQVRENRFALYHAVCSMCCFFIRLNLYKPKEVKDGKET